MTTMRSGDYIARVEYDEEIGQFHGRVINTSDVITFYGASVDELKREFDASVKAHLAFCAEQGVEPSKPFSGTLNLRLGPERHGRAALAAAVTGKSLNAWLVDAVDRQADQALGSSPEPSSD